MTISPLKGFNNVFEATLNNDIQDGLIEYFDWAKAVIDNLRGTHPRLETLFDEVYARRPHAGRWLRHAKPAVRGPHVRRMQK